MIHSFQGKFKKMTPGILMPIFLLSLIFPIFTAQSGQSTKIIFSVNENSTIDQISEKYNIEVKKIFVESSSNELDRIYSTEVNSDQIRRMQLDENIEYLETDQELNSSMVETDDTYFTLDSQNTSDQWYLAKTQIPEAWEYNTGSDNVIIAVLDTGIHAKHVELNDGRVIAGYNSITNENIPAGASSDDNGHGTAVAGVLGAIANNEKGIAGINWDVKLMPIKALNASGTGSSSAVSRGIVWAADHGANIINLSLGGVGFGTNQTLLSAITYAHNKGALIVAAAGNDLADEGSSLDLSTVYPVCADNVFNMVLGVAATDVDDRKADFSNYGTKCVDVSAPGKKIITTAFLPSNSSNSLLIYGSGTSLAAPIVSGIAALYKAYNPNLSNVEIRDIIISTADNIDGRNNGQCGGNSCNGLLGSGRVNAYNYFKPKPIVDGSMLRNENTREIYIIQNGMKRKISDFVFIQRGYNINQVLQDINNSLGSYNLGKPIPPLEGTLIKSPEDPTVYIITGDYKRVLTYEVFKASGYDFKSVNTVPDLELKNYPTRVQFVYEDEALIAVPGNPQVYMIINQVRRPITYFVFTNRKLSFSNLEFVSEEEFSKIRKPLDIYWVPPLDGTLVKSSTDPGVYIIENSKRKLLSYESFVAGGYSFSKVKILPANEIELIQASKR